MGVFILNATILKFISLFICFADICFTHLSSFADIFLRALAVFPKGLRAFLFMFFSGLCALTGEKVMCILFV